MIKPNDREAFKIILELLKERLWLLEAALLQGEAERHRMAAFRSSMAQAARSKERMTRVVRENDLRWRGPRGRTGSS
jgi:hypothetical protein